MFRRHPSEETNFWPIVSDFMLGLFLLSILLAYKDRTEAANSRKELESTKCELKEAQENLRKQKDTYNLLRSVTIEQSNKLGKEGDLPNWNLVDNEETDQKEISNALIENVKQAILRLQELGVSNNDMRSFVIGQSNKLASYLRDGRTVGDDCGAEEAEEALGYNIEKAVSSIHAVNGDMAELARAIHEIGDVVKAENLKDPQCVVAAVKALVRKVQATDRVLSHLSSLFGMTPDEAKSDDFVQLVSDQLDMYRELENAIRGLAGMFEELAPIAQTEDMDTLLAQLKEVIQKLQKNHTQLEKSVRDLVGMFGDGSSDASSQDITVVLALLKYGMQRLLKENAELKTEIAELRKDSGGNKGMPIFEISSKEVSFGHNESKLDANNKQIVWRKFDELKKFILDNKDKVTDIMFVGFTDKSGTEMKNADLGLQRATTIRTSWDEYVGKQPENERAILRSKITHNFSAGWSEAVVPASTVERNKAAGAKDRHISIYLIGLKKS